MTIDTDLWSKHLRERSIIKSERKILIARLTDSEQEKDLTKPVNCNGYGRVRHFQLQRNENWSINPLPIYPAAKAFGIPPPNEMKAQVFQNAACNWRCWYCFVDFNRLSADRRVSDYFTADELTDMYLEADESNRPSIIDLSGGQPDLVPEWVAWMMTTLRLRGLEEKVFLWSDDNLSNDYFWRHLTYKERRSMVEYPMYARVACFKGYDDKSFQFNTLASASMFDNQFDIYRRLYQEKLDLYAYVTFTAQPDEDYKRKVAQFVDRLQQIHPNLPLRTVPLEILVFTPTHSRIRPDHEAALKFQYNVHEAWLEELAKRFSDDERNKSIADIVML